MTPIPEAAPQAGEAESLKPCPFCGGRPISESFFDGEGFALCDNDDCGIQPEASGHDYVRDWNRRAPPPQTTGGFHTTNGSISPEVEACLACDDPPKMKGEPAPSCRQKADCWEYGCAGNCDAKGDRERARRAASPPPAGARPSDVGVCVSPDDHKPPCVSSNASRVTQAALSTATGEATGWRLRPDAQEVIVRVLDRFHDGQCDRKAKDIVVALGEKEPLWPISKDGPHEPDDNRRWLARQLMDSKNSAREAYDVVIHHPLISKSMKAKGLSPAPPETTGTGNYDV